MPPPKYKICKTCGNRNHPRAGRCAWCGEHLRSPMDWFSLIGMLLIVLLVVGLIVYTIQDRPPSPAKLRLPGAGPSPSAD